MIKKFICCFLALLSFQSIAGDDDLNRFGCQLQYGNLEKAILTRFFSENIFKIQRYFLYPELGRKYMQDYYKAGWRYCTEYSGGLLVNKYCLAWLVPNTIDKDKVAHILYTKKEQDYNEFSRIPGIKLLKGETDLENIYDELDNHYIVFNDIGWLEFYWKKNISIIDKGEIIIEHILESVNISGGGWDVFYQEKNSYKNFIKIVPYAPILGNKSICNIIFK